VRHRHTKENSPGGLSLPFAFACGFNLFAGKTATAPISHGNFSGIKGQDKQEKFLTMHKFIKTDYFRRPIAPMQLRYTFLPPKILGELRWRFLPINSEDCNLWGRKSRNEFV